MEQKLCISCTISPILWGNMVWQFSDSCRLPQRNMILGRTPARLAPLPWNLHHITSLTPGQAPSHNPVPICPHFPSEGCPRASCHQGEKPPSNFWLKYIHAYYLPMNPSVAIILYLKSLFECHVQQYCSIFLWPQLPLSLPMPCHTSDFFCEATDSPFSHLGLICHHPILLLALPCLRSHLNSPLLIWCGHQCSQLYWIPSSEWS